VDPLRLFRYTRFAYLVSLNHRTYFSLSLFFRGVAVFLIALSPGGKALQLQVYALVRNFDGSNLTSESPDVHVLLSCLIVLQISEIVEVLSPNPVYMCISELKISQVTGVRVTCVCSIIVFTLSFMKF
jgi:hypothetical protein